MKMMFSKRIRVAVAGFPLTEEKEKIITILHGLFEKIEKFSDESIIDVYTSPDFVDETLTSINIKHTTNLVVASTDSKSKLLSNVNTITNLELSENSIETFNALNDWVISRSDLLLILWDKTENSCSGKMHAIFHHAINNGIPCIRIDPLTFDTYYTDELSTDLFDEKILEKYLKKITAPDSKKLFSQETRKEFFLSNLWSILHSRFQKKYKRNLKLLEDPEDPILQENYFVDKKSSVQKKNHKLLLDMYTFFDEKANKISKKYREAIYFRSVLPFMATIFLAIGFYVETVGKYIIPEKENLFTMNLSFYLSIIAGIGFLIHAFINFYGYEMSKSTVVKQSLHSFVNSRYCAEFLRNAIYFVTFGISFKPKKRFTPDSVQLDENTMIQVNKIIRSLEPMETKFDKTNCLEILTNMIQMLDDQSVYHKNTKQKNLKISNALEKTSVVFFYAGFIFVLARGCFQFIVPFFSSSTSVGKYFLETINNGKSLKDFLQSFSNMLALMLPSWASYFSTKLSLNNFKNLTDHSTQMIERLETLKNLVEKTIKTDQISYAEIHFLAEKILDLQLSELSSWYSITATKTVTKL